MPPKEPIAGTENTSPDIRVSYDDACRTLETAIRGDTRGRIIGELRKSKDYKDALVRLRTGMQSNVFSTGAESLNLASIVRQLDTRTQAEGFHVLRDWDGKAERLNDETIPVDVLNFILSRGPGPEPLLVAAILLDYYFVYVLSLFALRAWDEGDPNDNLGRVTRMLQDLQGPNGSGQKFADNAETLILIATSHFEPDGDAYVRLLDKLRGLSPSHQLNAAIIESSILGCHLRYGFDHFYKRDFILMRKDNGPDYPWLCFSLTALMRAYAPLHARDERGPERDQIVEAILNGLSPDTRAFAGKPPDSLASCEQEYREFRELFDRHRESLLREFEDQRPSSRVYSPLALGFNFPHNIVKGVVADALIRGRVWNLTLNDSFSGFPRDEETGQAREILARTLMGYAIASPDTVRGRPTPSIIYDPYAAVRSFTKTMNILKEQTKA